MAREAGISGIVTLSFIVGRDGIPSNINVTAVKPEGLRFEDAAVTTMKAMKFIAALSDSQAVPATCTLKILFATPPIDSDKRRKNFHIHYDLIRFSGDTPSDTADEETALMNDSDSLSAGRNRLMARQAPIRPYAPQEDDRNVKDADTLKVTSEYDATPQLIGGDDAVQAYIRNNDIFPAMAREALVAGDVSLCLVVGSDGRPSNIKVTSVNPAGLGFEQAAVQIMKAMKFTPAEKNGRAVSVSYTWEISFIPPPIDWEDYANTHYTHYDPIGLTGDTSSDTTGDRTGMVNDSSGISATRISLDLRQAPLPPTPIGGDSAIANYIHDHDLFPKAARDAGIKFGWAAVTFVIDTDGIPSEVKVLCEDPEGMGFGDAAVTVIKAMTYKPVMENGIAVPDSTGQYVYFNRK